MKDNLKAEVRDLLVRAFTEEMKQVGTVSHSDCVALREDLIMLRDEDVKELLPFVLIDLLETHSNDYRNIENGDAVIRLLSPVQPTKFEHPELPKMTAAEEEHAARAQIFMAERQNKLYSVFSRDQAAAVAKWLEGAKSWEDLCFCGELIEIAHKYWSEKAALT
jgi:hypothetical protein